MDEFLTMPMAELLEQSPMQGVLTADFFEAVHNGQNQCLIKACYEVHVDPDALIKTAQLNAELQRRLEMVSSCQQNQVDLPCDIGDTAYCVNGYGSNRYIEKFTVDKIVISNEGIVLIDPNGAEWLARVCHFSLESAERALKAKNLLNIINENFDKEDIIIHLTYELDKAPQSEEVRKDIENYIRRLKEQRSNNDV